MIDPEETHRFAVAGSDREGRHHRTVIGWRETGAEGPNHRLVRRVVLMLDATPNTEVVFRPEQAAELLAKLTAATPAIPAEIPDQRQ